MARTPDYLSSIDAAEMLGLSVTTFRSLANARNLTITRNGKHNLYLKREIKQLVSERRSNRRTAVAA